MMSKVYAAVAFVHEPLEVDAQEGDAFPDDHPMVVARPDLFTKTDPTKTAAKAAPTKEK
jgi:hypothetical protein